MQSTSNLDQRDQATTIELQPSPEVEFLVVHPSGDTGTGTHNNYLVVRIEDCTMGANPPLVRL